MNTSSNSTSKFGLSFRLTNTCRVVVSLLLIGSLIWFFSSCANQKDPGDITSFESFYDKYEDIPEVTSMSVPGALLQMFAGGEDEETQELLKKVDNVSMFVHPTGQKVDSLQNDLESMLSNGDFQDMMEINDGGEKVIIKIQETDEIVRQAVIIVKDKNDELVIMSVEGMIPLEKMKELATTIDVNEIRSMQGN